MAAGRHGGNLVLDGVLRVTGMGPGKERFMSRTTTKEEGGINVTVSNHGLSSGWDIKSITIDGRPPSDGKAGEFATEEEAFKAAFERGQAEREARKG